MSFQIDHIGPDYLEIDPARAKHKSDSIVESLWNNEVWIAEEKLDGWRFLLHFGGSLERAYMTGRRTSEVTGRLSEKGMCAECLWPKWESIGYTVLDGEVMAPVGANFRDIAGIMNVDPEQARARIEEIGEPQYFAFDVLYFDGRDVRGEAWMRRRAMLTDLVPSLGNDLIRILPTIGYAEWATQEMGKKLYFDSIVAARGEGVVLKDVTAEYGDGWVKVKRETTLDVVISGFTAAKFGVTGKYHGQIGAAKVSVYTKSGALLEVAQVSGMDDATRLDMTANPGKWIGTVLEVTAYKWAKNRLQHPRFKRHKPEADPKTATFAKMMEDLGEEVTHAHPKPAQGSLF